MVYDEDPRRPMSYPIESGDRADAKMPMEPPKSEAIRDVILGFHDRFPELSAERIHERIRRVQNRHDVTFGEINHVFAELRRTLACGDRSYRNLPRSEREGPDMSL